MRFDHLKSLYVSGAVFLILLAVGFSLSLHKVLWLDELFTQQSAIDAGSYADILLMKFPDGNKEPLFYIIQKAVCNVFSYHLPVHFPGDFYRTRDIPSQMILRIPSNIFMALALSLIFYFFARFYSIFTAIYALGATLVSPLVWMYWAEARPYALWFLLTSCQVLLFSSAVISPKIKTAKRMFLTHILLALTTPACVFQITIVTLMLWYKYRYGAKQLVLIWALPTGIALFYYLVVPLVRIKTYLFSSNLYDAVMPERMFVYVLYALTAWVLPEKYKKISWNAFFLPVFLLFFVSAFFMLFMDIFTQNSLFGFFSRYLIFMVPADTLMYSLASYDLFQWSRRSPWICMNVSILLGGLLIMRGLLTYRTILASAIFLHSP